MPFLSGSIKPYSQNIALSQGSSQSPSRELSINTKSIETFESYSLGALPGNFTTSGCPLEIASISGKKAVRVEGWFSYCFDSFGTARHAFPFDIDIENESRSVISFNGLSSTSFLEASEELSMTLGNNVIKFGQFLNQGTCIQTSDDTQCSEGKVGALIRTIGLNLFGNGTHVTKLSILEGKSSVFNPGEVSVAISYQDISDQYAINVGGRGSYIDDISYTSGYTKHDPEVITKDKDLSAKTGQTDSTYLEAFSFTAPEGINKSIPTFCSLESDSVIDGLYWHKINCAPNTKEGDERGTHPYSLWSYSLEDTRVYYHNGNIEVQNTLPSSGAYQKQLIDLNSQYSFTVPGFNDADGDDISYEVSGYPAGTNVTFNSTENSFQFFGNSSLTPETHTISILSSDGFGSTTRTFPLEFADLTPTGVPSYSPTIFSTGEPSSDPTDSPTLSPTRNLHASGTNTKNSLFTSPVAITFEVLLGIAFISLLVKLAREFTANKVPGDTQNQTGFELVSEKKSNQDNLQLIENDESAI